MTKTRYSDTEIGVLTSALARAENAVREADAERRMARDALNAAMIANARHDFESTGGVVGETLVEIKRWGGWERPFIVVGFSVEWRNVELVCAPATKSNKPHGSRRRNCAPENVRIIKDAAP